MTQISTERVLADVIRTRLAGRGVGLTTGRVKDHPESVAVKDTDGRVYVVAVYALDPVDALVAEWIDILTEDRK